MTPYQRYWDRETRRRRRESTLELLIIWAMVFMVVGVIAGAEYVKYLDYAR